LFEVITPQTAKIFIEILKSKMMQCYSDRIILFIDILGFTNDVKRAASDSQIFNKLQKTLKFIRDFFGTVKYSSVQKLQFSDSLVVSIDANEPGGVLLMVRNASFAIHALFSNGYLCKGVITMGKLYHQGDILFGPIFLEAMRLEALEDKPMIIFHENLINQGRKYPTQAQIKYPDVEESYIMDYVDKIGTTSFYQIAWYKNYSSLGGANSDEDIRHHYTIVKSIIEDNIKKFNSIRVLNKYIFLKNQFNNSDYLKRIFSNKIAISPKKSKYITKFPNFIWDTLKSYLTKKYWKHK